MTRGVHHVSVVTAEHDRLVGFLRYVLGMDIAARITVSHDDVAPLFGWPSRPGELRTTLLGGAAEGLVEVIDCPWASAAVGTDDGSPAGGLLQVAFATPDVAEVLARAQACADDVVGPLKLRAGRFEVLVGRILVAGLRIQVTQVPG